MFNLLDSGYFHQDEHTSARQPKLKKQLVIVQALERLRKAACGFFVPGGARQVTCTVQCIALIKPRPTLDLKRKEGCVREKWLHGSFFSGCEKSIAPAPQCAQFNPIMLYLNVKKAMANTSGAIELNPSCELHL
ncbi:hypothetical protein FB451DRAFT_1194665 [Mycena latifolia]|nr:hypothetical protein FB451DRAFT_1194665 [Mycena latifolia]